MSKFEWLFYLIKFVIGSSLVMLSFVLLLTVEFVEYHILESLLVSSSSLLLRKVVLAVLILFKFASSIMFRILWLFSCCFWRFTKTLFGRFPLFFATSLLYCDRTELVRNLLDIRLDQFSLSKLICCLRADLELSGFSCNSLLSNLVSVLHLSSSDLIGP